jgi:NADPH:quinone reductase-like Zn-dependent oxidoreductase
MKAAVINAFGSVDELQIADIERPQIQPDEVLVRIKAAAVNPKDTFIRKGVLKEYTGAEFPMLTGFDFAGKIVAVGSEAGTHAPGISIYGMLDSWEGKTCAEFMTAKSHQFDLKPESLTFEEAAALPLVASTALQALRDEAGIKAGDSVCVNGASGGVGSVAVRIAKLLGASHVTAVSSAANHPFLMELGADHCVDYQTEDIKQSSRQFDVFFDVFGNQPFAAIKPVLHPKGIWVSTVLQPHVFESVEATKTSPGQKAKLVIVASRRQDLAQIRGWVDTGQLKPVIHQIYPLDRIAEAHAQQETKHTRGKLIIRIH